MATKGCRARAGRLWLLLPAIVALLGLVPPALAASGVREIAPIGASGSAAFNDACKDGGYMIGVRVYLGYWVDYIEMVCSDYRSDLTWRPRFVEGYGGGGGSATPKVGLCRDGWILSGLRMRFTKNLRQVHSIYGTCRRVGPPDGMGGGFAIYPDDQQAAETEQDTPSITCHDGEAAAGLSGRYGAHVNALGLNCRKYPPISPAESPGPVASSSGEPKPIGMIFCQGGGMAIGSGPLKLSIVIAFNRAPQSAKAAIPARGECAWSDRPIGANEPSELYAPLKGDVKSLVAAAQQGGIFLVHVGMSGTNFWVTSIDSVNVGFVPGTSGKDKIAGFAKPATPAPAGDDAGNDDAGGGNAGGGDVAPPMHADDGSCGGPGAAATVVIPEPNLHKLNVRSKPGGNVLGTVPEGAEVTVVGPCGSEAAAGFAKSTKPLGGAAGWCQLDAPVGGCVMAKYLDFSGGGGGDDAGAAPAAGFAKMPPKAEAPAPMGVSFGGRWAANAEDVSYTLSLKQKGSGVSGSFQGSDGSAGTLNGKLQGNVLRFSWRQTDGTKGTGQFVLSDDGQSFDGSYRLSDNSAQGSWSGTRQ